MKPNDLLATAGETLAYAEDYLDTRIELIKLSVAEKGSKSAADILAVGIVATLGLFALSAFSIAFALVLGAYLDSYPWGFTIVGLLYTFFAVLLFITRRVLLVQPILKQLINTLFNSNSNGN